MGTAVFDRENSSTWAGVARNLPGMSFLDLPRALVRHWVPPRLFYLADSLRGRSAGSVAHARRVFEYYQSIFTSFGIDLADRHVLEIGSGRVAYMACFFLAAGAKHVSMVDLYAASKQEQLNELGALARELGLDENQLADGLSIYQADLLKMDTTSVEPRPDLVVSNSCLEHVKDYAGVIRRTYALLADGGISCHSIDLKDHGAFSDPYRFLAYSDGTWNAWLNPRGGFHLNRARRSDYVRAFEDAGFSVTNTEDALIKQSPPASERLATRFRELPAEELQVGTLRIACRK